MTLVGIRHGVRVEQDPRDLVAMLVACHDRIRKFCALATRLAETHGEPAEEIGALAAMIHRYFTGALPLHVADEEESISPYLRCADAPAEVERALDLMTREHVAIEATLGALVPLWAAVAATPRRLPALRAPLAAGAARLAAMFAAHLRDEELGMFPAIDRWLSEAARGAILSEMRARRELPR